PCSRLVLRSPEFLGQPVGGSLQLPWGVGGGILGPAVQGDRETPRVRSRGPSRSEGLVRGPPQEERAGREELVALELHYFVVHVGERPLLRRFHDAIEGKELRDDDLAHIASTFLIARWVVLVRKT